MEIEIEQKVTYPFSEQNIDFSGEKPEIYIKKDLQFESESYTFRDLVKLDVFVDKSLFLK